MCAQTETTALHTAEIAVASQRAAEIELGYEDGTHHRIAKTLRPPTQPFPPIWAVAVRERPFDNLGL
jgi:hypothetical protein